MKLTFIGAARSVTGSSTILECNGKRILIDCGLVQGKDEDILGNDIKFDASSIDAVILTHAHIDHSGKLPLLVKEGYRGKIYATPPTVALLDIMLRDSAHIQEMEAEWRNRKAKRDGTIVAGALYNQNDALNAISISREQPYEKELELFDGIKFKFVDAGHLFGSASVIFTLKEDSEERTVVFSGDIGNTSQPLINDPTYINKADVVIMESTYGDRLHEDEGNHESQEKMTDFNAKLLAKNIISSFSKKGNVIIPSFSVGRTQEILYLIHIAMIKKYIPKDIPVYVDSPLSVKATRIFKAYLPMVADKQCKALIDKGIDPIEFDSLTLIEDVEYSKKLNFIEESKVIISSSGMCTAGRIKHHLKHNLWRPESTIIFCGYQASGTLGRSIVDGAQVVSIFGERIRVKAEVVQLHTLSGHADQKGLLRWIDSFKEKPKQIFINHGGKDISSYFASLLVGTRGLKAVAPEPLNSYDLINLDQIRCADATTDAYGSKSDLLKSLEELKQREAELKKVIDRLDTASRSSLNVKDAKRINEAIKRLADDYKNLNDKWNS